MRSGPRRPAHPQTQTARDDLAGRSISIRGKGLAVLFLSAFDFEVVVAELVILIDDGQIVVLVFVVIILVVIILVVIFELFVDLDAILIDYRNDGLFLDFGLFLVFILIFILVVEVIIVLVVQIVFVLVLVFVILIAG